MSLKIKNDTALDLSEVQQLVSDFYPYAKDRFGFEESPTLVFKSDTENANKPLGKTASYNPSSGEVVIYVDNRHPKDILRSFSHELVHHAQNQRGEFDEELQTNEGYAQTDKHLREMEKEAYLEGQLCLRDWEDKLKMNEQIKETIREAIKKTLKKMLVENTTTQVVEETTDATVEENDQSGEITEKCSEPYDEETLEEETLEEEEVVEEEETLQEWKNKTLNEILMEKWCK